jgi:hypothetical protein
MSARDIFRSIYRWGKTSPATIITDEITQRITLIGPGGRVYEVSRTEYEEQRATELEEAKWTAKSRRREKPALPLDIAWDRVYSMGGKVVGIVTFIASWIYAIANYGLFLGLGLGWIPSIFIGVLAGITWPLLLIIGGLLLLYLAR